ncbi:MAG: histidine ammonia-lyase [Chitinophagales bacterium]|nr:histidine ammonia-lyase [Chitinophagales bacterium]
MVHHISSAHLSIDQIEAIICQKATLVLSQESVNKINTCRTYLDEKIPKAEKPIYGVNTGFGSLCNIRISASDLSQLQYNLLVSHACGTGEELSTEIVQLMLLLKIQSLSYGHSGCSIQTIERLIDMYNAKIYPIVYQQGSLGASGDLAPLAHLCLPIIGLGQVHFQNNRYSGREINAMMGWDNLSLQSKEGLALLNGTQFMSACAVFTIIEARKCSLYADKIAAMSFDAFDGRIDAFHPAIHAIRPHHGQVKTAQNMLEFLSGSQISVQEKSHVQDPYSFRCIPQVHGASKDVLRQVEETITIEINSVTDNPNIFPEEDLVLSGGNFHGQPLALALDYLCLALAEWGSISERRTYLLISGQRGLPAYLIKDAGINSGLMIPQYTAASIVSQNKQLCSPSSIDSIVSSNGQEDHVSMGANAATKGLRVLENLKTILAIELLNAAQGLEFRRPLKSSSTIESLFNQVREHVSFIDCDRELWIDIASIKGKLFAKN